jgi:formylglycine-generating enzyme required for sulfatase activity
MQFNRERATTGAQWVALAAAVVGVWLLPGDVATTDAQAGPAARPSPRAVQPTTVQWVSIPGGSFLMGSSAGSSDEKPEHRVTVASFQMGRSEVTAGQYRRCVQAGSCTAPDTGGDCNWGKSVREDHPVNCVDWNQARAFATWAGGRLPSEAEWEYAARSGGRSQRCPWGDEAPTCSRAVMDNGCGRKSTWPVCSKTAGNTAQGLCDMAGNVWEWVQDWYHDTYAGAPTDGSAWESPTGVIRVYRGGSWDDDAGDLRATSRSWGRPGRRDGLLGFRLARSIP